MGASTPFSADELRRLRVRLVGGDPERLRHDRLVGGGLAAEA